MFRFSCSILGAALLLGAGVSGCSCDGDPPKDPDGGAVCAEGKSACDTADDCPERHICRADKQSGARCCERAPRKCVDKADCCPGQSCTTEGRCVDSFDACEQDSDCSEDGVRVCREWVDPVLGPTLRCGYAPCGDGQACPEGQFCFARFCVAAPPCGGACEQGEACVPQNDRCHPFGDRCALAPKPGHLVVFSDPQNVYDVCLMADLACEWAELPPLAPGDLGHHASIAGRDGKLSVAHYDGQYGDLVVSDFDLEGKLLGSVWVDGVPAGEPVVASPNGPRGGVVEPGPDVGRYADAALGADGTLYVAYYDRTGGDLRFVERAPGGAWSAPQVVDGEDADVGLFASLQLDPQGKPAIAYFQRGASETSSLSCASAPGAPKALLTGLKLARAGSEHPATASDWAIEGVACAARPPPPCFGCAAAGGATVCVADELAASGTRCATPASGCASCAATETCVSSAEGDLCAARASPAEVEGIPAGVGLFPSLAFKDATPIIAWYDRNAGNLVVSQKPGAGWTTTVIDGEEGGRDTGDVGLYPALAIAPGGNFSLAYHDFSRRGLRFYSKPTLTTLTGQLEPPEASFIDRGLSDPMLDGPSWVGADAALVFGNLGTFAAYQNSTASDLRLSRLDGASWQLAREWTDGALGFHADAVELDGKLYVVHARIKAKLADGKPVADNRLRVEVFAP